MKKVLIMGGAGFIGFNIAKFLAKKDYKITLSDNLSRGQLDSELTDLLISNQNIDFVEADFTNYDSFKVFDKEYDHLYMLAAVVGVNNALNNPSEIIRINTSITLNVLEWLKNGGAKKAIFSSTSENYAGTIDEFGYKIPTPEDVPLSIINIAHPRYTYAVTKMLGESGFLNYAKSYGFHCTVVRYHNVIGPRMGFKHVIPHLAERFLIGKEDPFLMYGHNQTRSFCDIDDAVRGTVAAIESENSNGEIYHLGSSDEISIEELIKEAGNFFNFKGSYKAAPTFPGSTDRRCPDIRKAHQHFGFEPKVSWNESVHKTLQWYKDFFNSGGKMHESSFEEPDV